MIDISIVGFVIWTAAVGATAAGRVVEAVFRLILVRRVASRDQRDMHLRLRVMKKKRASSDSIPFRRMRQ